MKPGRVPLYLLANLCFAVFVAAAAAINGSSGVHPLYVILLFALCSTPIIDLVELNGAQALLGIFSLNFLLFYGVLDVSHLLKPGFAGGDDGAFMSEPEAVILVGGALVQIAYRLACRSFRRAALAPRKDWPQIALVAGGLTLWLVCSALNWQFSVNIVTEATMQAEMRGFGSITGWQTTVFMLAHLAQPLGILMIAYAQCRYRRGYMMPLLIGVVLFQLLFGFVIDFKGEAFLGGVLAILTKLLVDGRVPKTWMVAMLAFIAVGFPVLQANRVIVRGQYGANSTQVAANIVQSLQRAFESRDRVTRGLDRSQTFAERLSLKSSVEIIVARTGEATPFQRGFTLAPLITAFVPRLVWADKPFVAVGRLMNKEFKISEVADTYISPSHLGELYWNFGWVGVVSGMTLIGALLGFIGGRFNLAESATLTRVMVVVVTIRLLILGSEGEIATQYVQWIRSMAAIGILHWCFARVPAMAAGGSMAQRAGDAGGRAADAPFPNLLR